MYGKLGEQPRAHNKCSINTIIMGYQVLGLSWRLGSLVAQGAVLILPGLVPLPSALSLTAVLGGLKRPLFF